MNARHEQQLQSFLGALPLTAAEKLARAVELDRLAGGSVLPHESILQGLRPALQRADRRPPRTPNPLRLVCQPFEDLLCPHRAGAKRVGRIARSSIMPIWTWVTEELDPENIARLTRPVAQAILKNDMAAAQTHAAELRLGVAGAMASAFEEIAQDKAKRKALAARLGGDDVLEDAREICLVMEAAPEIISMQGVIPRPLPDLMDDHVAEIKRVFRLFEEHAPETALYVVLVAMGRLAKPWQILRVLRAISKSETDTVVSATDLGVVGELLLDDLETLAQFFVALDVRRCDPEDVIYQLRQFAQLSTGMTIELGIRRKGEWGKRVLHARNQVASAMEAVLERAIKEIHEALPFRRIGGYRAKGSQSPDISRAPDPSTTDRARKYGTLIRASRKLSAEAAFTSAYARTVETLGETLEVYGPAIVETVRAAEESAKATAQAYLDLAVELTGCVIGDEEADILRRRGAVAARG
jgi:hypothetical protein